MNVKLLILAKVLVDYVPEYHIQICPLGFTDDTMPLFLSKHLTDVVRISYILANGISTVCYCFLCLKFFKASSPEKTEWHQYTRGTNIYKCFITMRFYGTSLLSAIYMSRRKLRTDGSQEPAKVESGHDNQRGDP